jgi:hypothetical protein
MIHSLTLMKHLGIFQEENDKIGSPSIRNK